MQWTCIVGVFSTSSMMSQRYSVLLAMGTAHAQR